MKKFLAIFLGLVLVFGLVACGGNGDPVTDTASGGDKNSVAGSDVGGANKTDSDASTDSEEEWAPLDVTENKVIVSDYLNKRIVVYNLDLVGEGEDLSVGEIWALEGVYSASVKYRENTKYGNVVLTTNRGPVITDYETKETIWCGGGGQAGNNPHSIEILPSGNIVTASSTDGIVRIFNTYANINEGEPLKYKTYELPSAHGVLWDPEYEVVWALGLTDLVAYQVREQDGMEVLQKIGGMGGKLPKAGGHDLSADLMDSNYLWCTSGGVYHFNKETNEFEEKYDQHAKLNKNAVKGFGNNKNNNFIFSRAKGDDNHTLPSGAPGWSTDVITFGYWKGEHFLYLKEFTAENCAFYKARVLYGDYQ